MADSDKPTAMDKLKLRFGNNLEDLKTSIWLGEASLFEALTIINGVDDNSMLNEETGSLKDYEKPKGGLTKNEIVEQNQAPQEALAAVLDKYIRGVIGGDGDE